MTTHTNQFFSLTRFGNYAASALILRSRQWMLIAIAVPTGLFLLMTLIMMFNDKWGIDEWLATSMLTSVALGGLFIGSSFPALRTKKESISFLMVPASAFEKYLYELLIRLVLFCILFPVVFYIVGNLSLYVANTLKIHMESPFYKYDYFNKETLKPLMVNIPAFVGIIFFLFTMFYAGTTVFRRLTIIKTLVFLGGLIVVFAGYFTFLNRILKINRTWFTDVLDELQQKANSYPYYFICAVFIVVSIFALVYAYFKLKEKELK
jgi:hypothetical protein